MEQETLGGFFFEIREELDGIFAEQQIAKLVALKIKRASFNRLDREQKVTALCNATQSEDVKNIGMIVDMFLPQQEDAQPKKKNQPDPAEFVTEFNLGLGKRWIDRSNLQFLPKVVWAALVERSGLRTWIIDSFNREAFGEITDPALSPLVATWFRQVGTEESSASVNGIEILGKVVRKKAMLEILRMFSDTEFDIILSAITEIQRGVNKAATISVLGLNAVETRSVPDEFELSAQLEVLLEALNRLYVSGLHSQDALALVNEYGLIYRFLSDPGFAAGIEGIRVAAGSDTLEALKRHMPPAIRAALLMAEKIRQSLEGLISFDATVDPLSQFLKLGPVAQAYGIASRNYSRELKVETRGAVFVGIVGLLEALTVEVQVTVTATNQEFRFETPDPAGRASELSFNSFQRSVQLIQLWLQQDNQQLKQSVAILLTPLMKWERELLHGQLKLAGSPASAATEIATLTEKLTVQGAQYPGFPRTSSGKIRALAVVLSRVRQDLPGYAVDLDGLIYLYTKLRN